MKRAPVRHHPRGRIESRQPHGLVASRTTRVRRADAAVQQRLPRRGGHPRLALRRRARRLRDGLATAGRRQPVPGRHGPHLLPPLRDRLQQGAGRRGRRRSTPSSASWATWRSSGAGSCRVRARRPGSECSSIGGGPSGLSAAYHLRRLGHEVELVDSAPKLGGMMRYGIPAYRLPRCDPRCRESSASSPWASVSRLDHAVHDIERERREGGFDAVFLAVGAQLARSDRDSGGRLLAHPRRGITPAPGGRGRSPSTGTTCRYLRRRGHRARRGEDGPAARCHRRRDRVSPQSGAHARPRRRTRRGHRRRV